jgi:hypothetical protein
MKITPSRVLRLLILCVVVVGCQRGGEKRVSTVSGSVSIAADNPAAAVKLRRETLAKLPEELRIKWKKFGQWDYKQFDSVYRDFTLFNFGATAKAARLSQEQIDGLLQLASPTPNDVRYMRSFKLQASFPEKKDRLVALVDMLKVDSHLSRVSDDFTSVVDNASWPKGKEHLEASRLGDYRMRCDKLGLQEGILRTKDYASAVFFIVDSEGLCIAGASCGYLYSQADLPNAGADAVAALDKCVRENPGSHGTILFEKLENHWFAFYEVD